MKIWLAENLQTAFLILLTNSVKQILYTLCATNKCNIIIMYYTLI